MPVNYVRSYSNYYYVSVTRALCTCGPSFVAETLSVSSVDERQV